MVGGPRAGPRPSGPTKYLSYSNHNVWQPTVDDKEAVLDRVLRDHSRDPTANAQIDMVNTGLPLRGAALVRNWQARTADSVPVGALGTLPQRDVAGLPGHAIIPPRVARLIRPCCARRRHSPIVISSSALTQLTPGAIPIRANRIPLSITSGV